MRNHINKLNIWQVICLQLLKTFKIYTIGLLLVLIFPNVSMAANLAKPSQIILSNGLRVVLVKDKSLPVVSVQMWYEVGSSNERLGKTGLAHLTEHMLFKSVGNLKNNEISLILSRAGVKFNAVTSQDFTAFYELGTNNNLNLMLHTESLRMKSVRFKQNDLNIEKSRITKDIESQINDNQKLLLSEVEACAFARHPYQNPLCGMVEDVNKLSLGDVEKFYKDHYTPNNATLIVVGNFNQSEVLKEIEKLFGHIPPRTLNKIQTNANPPLLLDHRICFHKPTSFNTVTFAYRAPKASDKLTPTELVLDKLLNKELLKRKNDPNCLFKSFETNYNLKHEPGLFTITFTTNNDTSVSSLESMLNQTLKAIASTNQADLSVAKNLSYFDLGYELRGPFELAFELGLSQSLGGWQYIYNYLDEVKNVNLNDIKSLINNYFNSNHKIIAMISQGSDNTFKAIKPKENPVNDSNKTPLTKSATKTKATNKNTASKPNSSKHKDKANKAKVKTKSNPHGQGYHFDETEINNDIKIDNTIHPPIENTDNELTPTPNNIKAVIKPEYVPLNNKTKLFILSNQLSPLVCVSGSIGEINEFNGLSKQPLAKLYLYLLNNPNLTNTCETGNLSQDSIGINKNCQLYFYLSQGQICFKAITPSDNLSQFLLILKHRLEINFTSDTDMTKIKLEFAKHLQNEDDSINSITHNSILRALIKKDTPFYPIYINESLKRLTAISIDDLKKFETNLNLNQPKVLILSGNVSKEEAVESTNNILKNFSSNPACVKPAKIEAANPVILKSTVYTHLFENKKVIANFAKLIPCDHNYAQNLAQLMIADCALIQHPIFAKLNKNITMDSANIDEFNQINSKIRYLPDYLLFTISLPLDKNTYKTNLINLKSDLASFSKLGLTEFELTETKKYLSNTLPIASANTIETAATSLIETDINRLAQNINSVSLFNINKFIQEKLSLQKSTLVLLQTRSTK